MKNKNFWKIAFFALVAVIVISAFVFSPLGRIIIGKLGFSNKPDSIGKKEQQMVVPAIKFDFDDEILAALEKANNSARLYINEELDKWIEDVMSRLDDKFLDDYFGFIQTKSREIRTFFQFAKNKLSLSDKTAEEMLTQELEEKISNLVLRPEITEATMKIIVDNAIEIYYSCLDKSLQEIQVSHNIPDSDWKAYISDLCMITMRDEQTAYNRNIIPITSKAIIVSGVTITAYVAKPAIEKIAKMVSAKIATKTGVNIAEKAGAQFAVTTATKTGSNIAARTIPFIGCAIIIGVGVWDIIDYKVNSNKGKKILRENFSDYLSKIKAELMGNSSDSIMSSIIIWENNFKQRLAEKNMTCLSE